MLCCTHIITLQAGERPLSVCKTCQEVLRSMKDHHHSLFRFSVRHIFPLKVSSRIKRTGCQAAPQSATGGGTGAVPSALCSSHGS